MLLQEQLYYSVFQAVINNFINFILYRASLTLEIALILEMSSNNTSVLTLILEMNSNNAKELDTSVDRSRAKENYRKFCILLIN